MILKRLTPVLSVTTLALSLGLSPVGASGASHSGTSGTFGASGSAGSGGDSGSSSLQNLFVNIADKSMPSVVNIFTTKRVRINRYGAPPSAHDLWRGFFDDFDGFDNEAYSPAPQTSRPMALGTGFVIESFDQGGGLIITNNHVIEGADEIKVKFTENDDERESSATLIGTDPELDVALLKVKTARRLVAVHLGDSERLKVGEWIAAIGNPFGHGHSVSHGIVSAKARTLPGGFGKYLQVDAPINPGNSGGPLVNMNGEVIGINNAIDARGSGIGFAIPINAVKNVLSQLKSSGRVERGYIGVGVEPRPQDGAPVVTQVVPRQPAYQAGIRPRDVILSIDNTPIKSPGELVEAITRSAIGRKVDAEILRAGHPMRVSITVSRRPSLRQVSSS